MITLHLHSVHHLVNLHLRAFLEQFGKQADMGRIEVGYEYKGDAAIMLRCLKKGLECLQATSRGAQGDDGEPFLLKALSPPGFLAWRTPARAALLRLDFVFETG